MSKLAWSPDKWKIPPASFTYVWYHNWDIIFSGHVTPCFGYHHTGYSLDAHHDVSILARLKPPHRGVPRKPDRRTDVPSTSRRVTYFSNFRVIDNKISKHIKNYLHIRPYVMCRGIVYALNLRHWSLVCLSRRGCSPAMVPSYQYCSWSALQHDNRYFSSPIGALPAMCWPRISPEIFNRLSALTISQLQEMIPQTWGINPFLGAPDKWNRAPETNCYHDGKWPSVGNNFDSTFRVARREFLSRCCIMSLSHIWVICWASAASLRSLYRESGDDPSVEVVDPLLVLSEPAGWGRMKFSMV